MIFSSTDIYKQSDWTSCPTATSLFLCQFFGKSLQSMQANVCSYLNKVKKKNCKFSFWCHWTVPRRQESHNALQQTSGHIALGSIGLELEHFFNLWSLNCVQANHGVKLFFKGYSVAVYSGTWSAFYAPREACPRWGPLDKTFYIFKPLIVPSSQSELILPCHAGEIFKD